MGRTGQLEDFGGEVLEDCGRVDGRLGTDTHVVLGTSLEVTVNTTDRELFHTRVDMRRVSITGVVTADASSFVWSVVGVGWRRVLGAAMNPTCSSCYSRCSIEQMRSA